MKLPLILLLLGLPMASMAHGGGVPVDGCHTEHATGQRHCHDPHGATSHPVAVHTAPIHVAALPHHQVSAPTACYVAPCLAPVVHKAPVRKVPKYWSKDVDVAPEPIGHRPVRACPGGTIASNLIIDQHPSTCARTVAPLRVAQPVCTTCAQACAVTASCGTPIAAVQVDTTSRIAARRASVDPDKHSFYFKNCEEAFTARRAPLHRGDDGYRPELDEDGDGMACDPMVMW